MRPDPDETPNDRKMTDCKRFWMILDQVIKCLI
jgi:hypothetical protein